MPTSEHISPADEDANSIALNHEANAVINAVT
jgi:hypothetical protein